MTKQFHNLKKKRGITMNLSTEIYHMENTNDNFIEISSVSYDDFNIFFENCECIEAVSIKGKNVSDVLKNFMDKYGNKLKNSKSVIVYLKFGCEEDSDKFLEISASIESFMDADGEYSFVLGAGYYCEKN